MWNAAKVKTQQELQQVGGLVSAHAYSRTFHGYPDPTIHLYLNTDNPFHNIPTLFAPILSFLHFPRFPFVPV